MPQLDVYIFSGQVFWLLLFFSLLFFSIATVFLPRLLFSLVVRHSCLISSGSEGSAVTEVSSTSALPVYFSSVEALFSSRVSPSFTFSVVESPRLFFASSPFSRFAALYKGTTSKFFLFCLLSPVVMEGSLSPLQEIK